MTLLPERCSIGHMVYFLADVTSEGFYDSKLVSEGSSQMWTTDETWEGVSMRTYTKLPFKESLDRIMSNRSNMDYWCNIKKSHKYVKTTKSLRTSAWKIGHIWTTPWLMKHQKKCIFDTVYDLN